MCVPYMTPFCYNITLSTFSQWETDGSVWGALYNHVFYESVKIPNDNDFFLCFSSEVCALQINKE